MKQQSGFTLIELIAVIVILGIIAATAVPRFVDLTGAAQEASTNAIAGSLSSGSTLNHANNVADDAGLTITSALVGVATCPDVAGTLEGGLPAGYTITAGTGTELSGGGVGSEGGTSTCEVVNDDGDQTANFTAYGVVDN